MYKIHLTKIEKEVLKKLGFVGPLSGYDFHLGGKERLGKKPLMSPGHWETIKQKLGPAGKNLIEELKGENVKEKWLASNLDATSPGRPLQYQQKRKRKKKLYWFTDGGFWEALKLGVPSKRLFFWFEEIYNPTENVCFLRDLASELGEAKLRNYANHVIWENGQLQLGTLPLGKGSKKYGKALFKVMQLHPNAECTRTIKKMLIGLREHLKNFEELGL